MNFSLDEFIHPVDVSEHVDSVRHTIQIGRIQPLNDLQSFIEIRIGQKSRSYHTVYPNLRDNSFDTPNDRNVRES